MVVAFLDDSRITKIINAVNSSQVSKKQKNKKKMESKASTWINQTKETKFLFEGYLQWSKKNSDQKHITIQDIEVDLGNKSCQC